MHLVILTPPEETELSRSLLELVKASFPQVHLHTHHSPGELATALRLPMGRRTMALLLVHDRQTMEQVLAARAALNDMDILLVLPDGSPETLARGHLLRPRFLTTLDEEPAVVREVLKAQLYRGLAAIR